uniref:Apple domain-containing protein n=1 Tax=Plectus sambesii TaxID=2011161 RepID=A0A914VEQ0_9BILA
MKDKRAPSTATISSYDDLTHYEMCAYQCTKDFNCRSIAFNAATKNCLLQYVESEQTAYPSIAASGYI